mmetsp:Transcript_6503/g.15759  ORF Transcript_6503/g.15759 Transcript_6503/m.15759 type:complete len:236 (+) Transcript_6503:224-931(+)
MPHLDQSSPLHPEGSTIKLTLTLGRKVNMIFLNWNFRRGGLSIDSKEDSANQHHSCTSKKGADGFGPTDLVEDGDSPYSSNEETALGQWVANGKAQWWKAGKNVTNITSIPECSRNDARKSTSLYVQFGHVGHSSANGQNHHIDNHEGQSESNCVDSRVDSILERNGGSQTERNHTGTAEKPNHDAAEKTFDWLDFFCSGLWMVHLGVSSTTFGISCSLQRNILSLFWGGHFNKR